MPSSMGEGAPVGARGESPATSPVRSRPPPASTLGPSSGRLKNWRLKSSRSAAWAGAIAVVEDRSRVSHRELTAYP